MLAIQYIHINWDKGFRVPDEAAKRRPVWEPKLLSSDIDLNGNGNFLNVCDYVQEKGGIIPVTESARFRDETGLKVRLGGSEKDKSEVYRKTLIRLNEIAKSNKGRFFRDLSGIDLPGVEFSENGDEIDCIWYSLDDGRHVPVRTGTNINYNNRSSAGCGKRIKCVKAFSLAKGERGKMMFNYRVPDWHGGYTYSQYMIYIVNTENLSLDTFVKSDYGKSFEEMAHLF